MNQILMKNEDVVAQMEISIPQLLWKYILCFLLYQLTPFFIIRDIIFVKSNKLTVTNKRVIGEKGIINKTILDIAIKKINTVSVEKTLFTTTFVINANTGIHRFTKVKNANFLLFKINELLHHDENLEINKEQLDTLKQMNEKL